MSKRNPNLPELKGLRTYSTKIFDVGNGQRRAIVSGGIKHYKDKLGDGGYHDINFTLQWDDVKKEWFFNTNNWHPRIPEYADDWIEFRDLYQDKDQAINFKATCNHVQGILVPNIPDVTNKNAIIYPDAFGVGIDYIVYFTVTQMKKVVRIRDGHKPNTDTQFEFEVQFPDGADIYRATKKEDIGDDQKDAYKLDKARDKTFDTGKKTLIGSPSDEGESFTYIQPFRVWDTKRDDELHRREQVINVDFAVRSGKAYITKNITAQFLSNSFGDVYTDDTTSITSGAGDGYLWSGTGGDWTTQRNLTTADDPLVSTDTASQDYAVFSWTNGSGSFQLYRCWLPFDTSGIGANATITAVDLVVNVKKGTLVDAQDIHIMESTVTSLTNLDNDFDNFDNFVRSPSFGSFASSVLTTSYADVTITLNSSGESYIDPTGNSSMHVQFDKDYSDVDPTGYSLMFMTYSENGADEPTLDITFTPPSGPDVSDQLNITESVTTEIVYGIDVSDQLNITESVTTTNTQLGDTNVSDQLNITESVTATNTQLGGIDVSDSVDITESTSADKTQALVVDVSDSVTVSEDIERLGPRVNPYRKKPHSYGYTAPQ